MVKARNKNHGTLDSRLVPHRGTNWTALQLTAQIGGDAMLSKSYGHGWTEASFKYDVPLYFASQDGVMHHVREWHTFPMGQYISPTVISLPLIRMRAGSVSTERVTKVGH